MTRCCDGARCRLLAPDPRHGTPSGYSNFHCRCRACTAVASAYRAELYRRNARAAGRQITAP